MIGKNNLLLNMATMCKIVELGLNMSIIRDDEFKVTKIQLIPSENSFNITLINTGKED